MARLEERNESPVNLVLESVRNVHLPNRIEASLYLQMRYEQAFGIFDHDAPDDPNTPWPLMAMSPREDLARVDPLDFRLDQYAENRVFEIFGIPFDELIQFPRRDFLKVINSAKKHSARLAGVGSSQLAKLAAVFDKLPTAEQQQHQARQQQQQRKK